jgi:hypothetical protein
MNASAIVNKLLEAEGGIDSPEMNRELYAGDPGQLLAGALRDELVERGWRNIQIHKPNEPEGHEWIVSAGFIDNAYREHWMATGARVAPPPADTFQLRGRLVQSFKAACKRVKTIVGIKLVSLEPAHDDYDLHTAYDDFEDDPGDWRVTFELVWKPETFQPGFWGKASQALGYEDKPYQQAAKPPSEPSKPRSPVRSLLTPEQQDAADERHRQMMAYQRQKANGSEKDFEQRIARFRREIEGGRDRRDVPDYLY